MTRTGLTRFPPPTVLKGRTEELSWLAAEMRRHHPAVLALVGPGGSGKSTLAAALGRRVARSFRGGIHWFRVGGWSPVTLLTMLALRFGTNRSRLVPALRRHLRSRGDALVVLDNHEDDHAVATLLEALSGTPLSWLITARRCLLGGVTVYPVNPPLVTRGGVPFPRVKLLTRLLRHNPLSLSVADALVRSGATTAERLERDLRSRGAGRITVIRDEDDLPEVRLLIDWIWGPLTPSERRLLAVLGHLGGDHVDEASLLTLARIGQQGIGLERLKRWRLVQEPFAGRYCLHATVRRAVAPRTRFSQGRLFAHYVGLLEREPARLEAEQTHLFAAMDFAQSEGGLAERLRMAALLARLGL